MKKVIIIFKDKSHPNLVKEMGGNIVDTLESMPKIIIAEIPENRIDELSNHELVDVVEIDGQLQIENQADPVSPHVVMNGTSHIQIPTITYDSILLDVEIDVTRAVSKYYFDNRPSGTAYFYSNSSLLDMNVGCDIYIDGVKKTSGTKYISDDKRCLIEIRLPAPVSSSETLIFSRNGVGFNGFGKIYSLTIKNGGSVSASYNMATGTFIDQSGNGKNAVLIGGEWVGVVVEEPNTPYFAKADGGLNWALTALRVKDYWDRGITGRGEKVAVFDVAFPYHSYMDNYAGAMSTFPNKDVYQPAQSGAGAVHGLETTSQVNSAFVNTNSGFHSGVGVGIELYVVKLHDNYGDIIVSDFIRSINWAISKGISIISVSMLIQDQDYTSLKLAIDVFINTHNGVMLMASGNQNGLVPAKSINAYDSVYLVGGIGMDYKRQNSGLTGSNYGNNVEFMGIYDGIAFKTSGIAPLKSDEMGTGKGTSYACPQAAGIFAMYKQMYKGKTKEEIIQKMNEGALKLDGRTSWDMYYGHGLLQPNEDIMKLPRKAKSNGLRFSGLNDYIDCGNSSSIDLSNNFTLIADLSQDYGNNGWLFSKNDPSVTGEGIYYGVFLGHRYKVGNKISIAHAIVGKNFKQSHGSMSISDNTRHRLTVVYSYPKVMVYVDGILIIDSISLDGNMILSSISSGSPRLTIGSSKISSEASFAGVLYEVKIYNRSLPEADVKNNDNNTNGLKLHYKFNGSETTVATDLSGNGNNGIIVGAQPEVKKIV